MSAADLTTNLGGNRNPFNYSKVEQISRDNVTTWITNTEIKDQVNLFGDDSQNDFLEQLETAARQYVEDYLGISIYPIGYRVYYDAASLYGTPLALDLPQIGQNSTPASPAITIQAVKYYDASNTLVTVTNTEYYFDQTGNKIVLNNLPTDINTDRTSPVLCEYTTVASPFAAYPVVRQAALMLITHWYNTRSNTTDKIMRNVPFGFDALLRNYKPLVL